MSGISGIDHPETNKSVLKFFEKYRTIDSDVRQILRIDQSVEL
jgi:hypothetical protein